MPLTDHSFSSRWSNCGLRPRSLLHYRGKISKNLTTGELPKGADAVRPRATGGATGTPPWSSSPTGTAYGLPRW
jgi:hypothetical protein